MLHEGERLVKPEDISKQVEWEKAEGAVVLILGKKGEQNALHMSSITVGELALLTAQLQAHLTCLLGPMNEQ